MLTNVTKKGKNLKEDVIEAVEQVNNEVLAVFSNDEREALKNYLRTLAGISL